MDLRHVLKWLEEEGLGQPGVDLFREHMPQEHEKGLLVTEQMPASINKDIKNRKGSFQIIARGKTQDEVRDRLKVISDFLTANGLEEDDTFYHWIVPRHEPLIYPKTEANLVEASVNFDYAANEQAKFN